MNQLLDITAEPQPTADAAPLAAGRRETRLLAAILSFVALVYAVTPLWLYGARVYHAPDTLAGFWSPDSGARFAMIRNWIAHGSLTQFTYAYADADPSGHIHPITYFLFHRPGNITAMYPPLFPFLSGLLYRLLGFKGLTLLPCLCGLATLLVLYATARRLQLKSRLVLVLLTGLATPLWIYSSVYWDHSALMLIVAIVAYWMLRAIEENSERHAIAAGAFIAGGMWLHEQFLALFVAALLASAPALREYKRVPQGIILGFVPVAGLWAISNWLIYGTLGGAHLGENVLQNSRQHPFNLSTILDPVKLADRGMLQLLGSGPIHPLTDMPRYCWFGLILAGFAAVSWMTTGRRWAAAGFAGGLAAAVMAFWLVLSINGKGTPDGLFEATPLLIPALGVRPWSFKTAASTHEVFMPWISRMVCLFLVFLVMNPMYPGVDWGSRYLLSSLPMLALLTAYWLESHGKLLSVRGRRSIALGAGAIAAMSVACQVMGLIWIQRCLTYDRTLNIQTQAVTSPVMVTNADFNARLLPVPEHQARFWVRNPGDAELLMSILYNGHVPEMAYVGFANDVGMIEQAMKSGGLQFTKIEDRPLFDPHPMHEAGDAFQLIRYRLKPAPRGND